MQPLWIPAAVLIAATTVVAQPSRTRSQDPGQNKMARCVVASGDELRDRVKTLRRELTWHHSLGTATSVARRKNKPIFWVQALGDLDGFT